MLPIIHMFWHGRPLSILEQLSMQSFLDHGHELHLYVYEKPNNVPAKVTIKDARDILPFDCLFYLKKRGSVSQFSDWIRYKILYEQGGIWADTDVICLQAFDYESDYIFGLESDDIANVAVLGLPKGDFLAEWMLNICNKPNQIMPYDSYKEKKRKIKRKLLNRGKEYIKWGEWGPWGLSSAAKHLGLFHHALPFWHFYAIGPDNWQTIFDSSFSENPDFLKNCKAIHLWNDMHKRHPNFNANDKFPDDSLIETLKRKHGFENS